MNVQPGKWYCIELPVTNYLKAWDLQLKAVEKRNSGELDADLLILLEHFPVFTLGRRGGEENLTVSRQKLISAGIDVIQVERGGNITYHGPGQLVGYPVCKLRKAGFGVAEFVENLEELMIRTASEYNITAVRNPLNRGVWVGNNKLGSIGISVRKGISFHGFAFNVKTNLTPFTWINPCGLSGIGVTSMENETAREIDIYESRQVIRKNFEHLFRTELIDIQPADLTEL